MKISDTVRSFALLSCLWGSSCNDKPADTGKSREEKKIVAPVAQSPDTLARIWDLKDYYSGDPLLEMTVDSIYKSLPRSEKAAQMIMAATSEYDGIGLPFNTLMGLYKNKIIGSVLFLKGRRPVFTKEVRHLNEVSARNKIFPAVFACDCEPSLFHKKFTDADSLTPANQLYSVTAVQDMATLIAAEMKKMGFHWNFAPVADISINKEVIDNRSFGDNNNDIISKSSAFIQTSYTHNIVTSVKHFPGHGAVKGDSHKSLVYIDSALTELDNFISIIRQSNPISVMVGHIAIKNTPGLNSAGLPATLSKLIVTGLLQDSIGFKGIIVTDAMNMGAVKNINDADFRAVMAGNDLVLLPKYAESLHQRIMKLLSDKKTQQRVEMSIKKIIRLKLCLGVLNN